MQSVRLFADPFRWRLSKNMVDSVVLSVVFDKYKFQLPLISSLMRDLNNSPAEFFVEIPDTAESAKHLTNRFYLRASL